MPNINKLIKLANYFERKISKAMEESDAGTQFTLESGVIMARSPIINSFLKRGERLMTGLIGEEKAEEYKQAKATRDGAEEAHVTVIKPNELRDLVKKISAEIKIEDAGLSNKACESKAKEKIREKIAGLQASPPQMKGLGEAEKDGKKAFFAVLDWQDGKRIREEFGLDPDAIHFHITIGFEGGDVHDVAKNEAKYF